MNELDQIDRLATASLDGYLVRKDLVTLLAANSSANLRSGVSPGSLCASINEDEIRKVSESSNVNFRAAP